MQGSTVEDIEVSSHPVQSGNQVDYVLDLPTAAGSAYPGESSEATWDLDFSSPERARPPSPHYSSNRPLIRKTISKRRKNAQPEGRKAARLRTGQRGNEDHAQTHLQRPRAPHNTSQYIMTEKAQSPPTPVLEDPFTAASQSPSDTMIGLVTWADLERAEHDLQRGTVGASSGIASTELDIPGTPATNRLHRQEQRSPSGVVNSQDIVTVLLREIKLRDRLLERLTVSHPSSSSPLSS